MHSISPNSESKFNQSWCKLKDNAPGSLNRPVDRHAGNRVWVWAVESKEQVETSDGAESTEQTVHHIRICSMHLVQAKFCKHRSHGTCLHEVCKGADGVPNKKVAIIEKYMVEFYGWIRACL